MKILAGIPTYHRFTAPMLAEQFSRFVDHVLIVHQDTKLRNHHSYELIAAEPSLSGARNIIYDYARAHNYDLVLQSDDDLKMSDDYLKIFIALGSKLVREGVGSFCGKSRLVQFWDGKGYSNKDWEVRPRMNQIFLISADTAKRVGPTKGELFEDLDYALRLIKAGLVPAQMSVPGQTYNHTITRHEKDEAQGGYSYSFMQANLPGAIKWINDDHGGLAHVEETKSGRHRVKFNWDTIRPLVRDLGLGYTDKKGIHV